MPKPVKNEAKPKPVCVACSDTGKDSKGRDCIPCRKRKGAI